MNLDEAEAEDSSALGATSPLLALFRADLRRYWSGRTLRLALSLVGGVLVLQLLVGALVVGTLPAVATNSWVWLSSVAAMLGLHAGWSSALLQASGFGSGPSPRLLTVEPIWAAVPLGIADVVVHLLLPAFAAMSLAPDRESRRLDELVLAGFTPRQLLLAKGLAALLPLLALWAATRLLGAGVWFLFTRHAVSGLPAALMPAQGPLAMVVTSVGFLAHAAGLVCISALCARYRAALLGCYATSFVLLPVLQLVVITALAFLHPAPSTWGAFYANVPAALSATIFAVLLWLALRALEHPDDLRGPRHRGVTGEPIG
jgi:hypothetical protein